jgi:glycosyltransferase involved in cell wall biosynthesis
MRIRGKAPVMFSDPRFSIAARWKAISRQIGAFQPDVILFVGLWSPLVWLLRESFPVLGMSLHAMPPLAPVDIWLAANPGGDMNWPGMPEPQHHPFAFRFWPSEPGDAASRSTVGVPQDAVLLVTTGHRLHLEMPAAWCAQVVGLLDENPQAHWLLIGLQPQHHTKFLGLHARVHVLPAQEDLAPWLRLCDVYVNPPRVGGGASVAMAMGLGVPVVSRTGGDGGDKVGDFAASSPEAFRARLKEWIADAPLRRQAGQSLQAKFRDELDLSAPEAGRRLLLACELAQRAFHARQTAGQACT